MTWPDLFVLAIVAFSAIMATRRGFMAEVLSLAGFVLALVAAFTFYSRLAPFFADRLGWSPVWTEPAAFLTVWLVVGGVFLTISRAFTRRMSHQAHASQVNRLLAILPGALQGLISSAVLVTILALLPVSGGLRQQVVKSPVAGKLAQTTLALERPFESIFGPAGRQTLGFVTVKPPTNPSEEGEGSIDLHFTVGDAAPEPDMEEAMLQLVNQERTSRGIAPLEMDAELRLLARTHADDMFKRGYFAHNTPEGVDPFERMRRANIVFGTGGENLALAPALDIAHNGLMSSPGHRANILNPQFHRVGIGVLDGGVYGKMFVQEFTD